MYFTFIFSERITITFSGEALKVCEHDFFQEVWAKSSVLVIYLIKYNSSKQTFFMQNVAFDVALSAVFVK